jgi:uncharacterized repeat protein (TIGR03803 family)
MTNTRDTRGWAALVVAAILMMLAAIASPAQTFTSLVSFDVTNGANPYNMSLVQGTDGNLYGTTVSGGTDEAGTVFKVTPAGTLTTLHSFAGTLVSPADGAYPHAGLVLGTNGILYGTTLEGGADDNGGTVFSITKAGVVTVLHSFCSVGPICSDGSGPEAPLIQAANGTFYGTTSGGGANGAGTVFSMTPAGKLTTLYSFCSVNGTVNGTATACLDGQFPEAALVQATNGIFYGRTSQGGANGSGTVFSITAGGTLTTLYSFCSVNGISVDCLDGDGPGAALVQASDGTFYGTTPAGGAKEVGTVFSITSGGALTTLYTFCSPESPIGCTDGENPFAGLIQATDGNFYGTTDLAGPSLSSDPQDPCFVFGSFSGCGTIFEISAAATGELITLHSFDGTDGFNYVGGNTLFQATNGTFYGITYAGGVNGDGTVFSLSVGLGPFVETLPTSGKVGAAVKILGTALTGATSVMFNGTAATFTVVSSSEITTIVPADATSGFVAVTTPSGTLTSNLQFLVTTSTSTGVALSPATTTLATEPDGTASPAKTVTLTNQSSSTITSISPSIGPTNAGTSDFSFAAGGTCGTSLAASSSCTYLVTYTPSVAGTEIAVLSVTDSVGTQTATLKGTGIGAALLPATTVFATEPDGTTSPAKTITLFNYTASSMTIIDAGAIGGTNPADFSITGGTCVGLVVLPAGPSSCTYTVTFTPSLVGAETATLSVTDYFDRVEGTQTVTLKGTGKP